MDYSSHTNTNALKALESRSSTWTSFKIPFGVQNLNNVITVLLLMDYTVHLSPSDKDKGVNECLFSPDRCTVWEKMKYHVLAVLLQFPSCIHLQQELHLIIHAKMQPLMHSINNWKWTWYYLVDCFLCYSWHWPWFIKIAMATEMEFAFWPNSNTDLYDRIYSGVTECYCCRD